MHNDINVIILRHSNTAVKLTPHFPDAMDRQRPYGNNRGNNPSGKKVRKMVALYDYDPQELSPNVDAEVKQTHKRYKVSSSLRGISSIKIESY